MQKNIFQLCLFLFIVIAQTANAETEIFTANPGEKKFLMNNVKIVEMPEEFEKISQTDSLLPIRAFTFKTIVDLPQQITVLNAKSDNAKIQIADNGKRLFVLSAALKVEIQVTLKDGRKNTLLMNRFYNEPKIVYDQCDGKRFPDLVPVTNSEATKSFVAISCIEASGQAKSIAISVSSDSEIVSSSLFDLKGKGERWRLFEVPDSSGEGALLGSVTVRSKSVDYKYDLIGKNSDVQDRIARIENLETENKLLRKKLGETAKSNSELINKNEKLVTDLADRLASVFNVYFSLGSESINLVSNDATLGQISKSGSGLYAKVEAKSEPIYKKFFINVGSGTTLPISNSKERLEHFEFSSSLSHESYEQSNFSIYPGLIMSYRGFSQPFSGLAVEVGQIGLSLMSDYRIGKDQNINLTIFSQPMGSSSLKSHYSLGLGYNKKLSGARDYEVGVNLEMQNMQVVNSSNLPKDVNSTVLSMTILL